MNESTNYAAINLINQLTEQSINNRTKQPTNRPTSLPTNQVINKKYLCF